MSLKVRLTETMRGLHHFVVPELGDPRDREIFFRIDWSGAPHRTFSPLHAEFMRFDAAGIIDVEGLTEGEATCSGTLIVDYIRDQKIRYELAFAAGERGYTFEGEKVGVNLLRPVELIKTHTTCYASITRDDGRVVSRGVVHFVPDEIYPFLSSVRLLLD